MTSKDLQGSEGSAGRVPVDMDELSEIMDNDEELLQECFDVFSNDMGEYLDRIKSSIEQEDSDDLVRSAHKLKGSLRYLAAKDAAAVALRLEQAGVGDSLGFADAIYQELVSECFRLKEFIDNYSR